jgi:hypothetical protein
MPDVDGPPAARRTRDAALVGRPAAQYSGLMKVAIELPSTQAAQLESEAKRLGVSVEDLARRSGGPAGGAGRGLPGGGEARARPEPRALSAPRLNALPAQGDVRWSRPLSIGSGQGLYPSAAAKASSLAFGLAMNHPFIDDNKRIAHAAMAVFLDLTASPSRRPSTSRNT